MECYSTTEKEWSLAIHNNWMDLEDIILSERSGKEGK